MAAFFMAVLQRKPLARFEYTHAGAPQVGLLKGSAQSVFETGQHSTLAALPTVGNFACGPSGQIGAGSTS